MDADDRFQMAVEAPADRVRLIRVVGALDRAAAAGLLRLLDAQLELIAARHCRVTDMLVDLEGVSSYEPGGLETVRHARHATAARDVRVHLTGCSGRFHQLPLRARRLLAEFSTFPTVEVALATLAPGADATAPGTGGTGRPLPASGPAAAPPPTHRLDGPGDLGAARAASRRPGGSGFPAPRRSSEPTPATSLRGRPAGPGWS